MKADSKEPPGAPWSPSRIRATGCSIPALDPALSGRSKCRSLRCRSRVQSWVATPALGPAHLCAVRESRVCSQVLPTSACQNEGVAETALPLVSGSCRALGRGEAGHAPELPAHNSGVHPFGLVVVADKYGWPVLARQANIPAATTSSARQPGSFLLLRRRNMAGGLGDLHSWLLIW